MRLRKLCVAAALSLLPVVASADPCAGASPFNDVAPSASYCTNTEWLANRNITLGCGGTNFCPDLPVTRAAMALFMNRLADAIISAPILAQDTTGAMTLTAGAVDNVICQTTVIPAVGYPRTFALTGQASVRTTSGVATMGLTPVVSVNGGAFDTFQTFSEHVGFDATYKGHVSVVGVYNLAAGATVAFGLGAFQVSGATSIAGDGRCHLLVQGKSRTGTSSPFDRQPSSYHEGGR